MRKRKDPDHINRVLDAAKALLPEGKAGILTIDQYKVRSFCGPDGDWQYELTEIKK